MHRSFVSHLVPALAALTLATAAASAASQTTATPSSGLNFQQVVERVVAQGYNDVREIERKGDKLYEIKARNGQGRRVELYVDARSGEVLREEVRR
jgi:uncharacterized membrane protein YkoI